jgi:hypothetical protein
MQRFRKFGELSWNEQLMFSEALFLQFIIGMLLKIVPFRLIPRLFTCRIQGTGYKVQGNRNQEPGTRNKENGTNEQIKAAIQRSTPYSPWKNKCLIQSLAARRMLNRRKITSLLSFGVAKSADGKTIAHAWLKVVDFEIVEKSGDYCELCQF